MLIPWLISSLQDALTGILTICMATLISDLTDAIIKMNTTYVYSNIHLFIIYLIVSVIIIPLLGYLCNIVMIKHALIHDRKVISRFLDKKYNKAMEMSAGEAQYRLENDPNDYRIIWIEIMTNYISIPIIAVYLLYNSIKLSWIYTLFTIALSIIKLIIPLMIAKINAKYDRITRDYSTEYRAYENDITKKPYHIVLLGIQNGMLERMDKQFWQYYNTVAKKKIMFQNVATFITDCVDTISSLLIILIGAYFVSKNMLSVGSVAAMYSFFMVYNNLFTYIKNTYHKRFILKNIKERLRILYQDCEIEGGYYIDTIETIEGSNVSYQYKDTTAFSSLNFSVSANDHISICGINGSGKSTFLKVISGLNEDYQGSIKVNGKELSTLNIDDWRKKVAFALQDPYLFPGTVLDNLIIGNLATKEEAIHMLSKLKISYLMDREINTQLNTLSGGERQKISIAMALLKNTPLLLLDEPSNDLDEESLEWLEKLIMNSDKTILFISHRPSMTKLSNRIIHFK